MLSRLFLSFDIIYFLSFEFRVSSLGLLVCDYICIYVSNSFFFFFSCVSLWFSDIGLLCFKLLLGPGAWGGASASPKRVHSHPSPIPEFFFIYFLSF